MALKSYMKNMITRRTMLLSILMALPFPALFGRIFYLQNISGQKYRRLAERNRINIRPLRPKRGAILDRYGYVMATDKYAYRLVIVPEQASDIPSVLNKISQLVPLSSAAKADVLEEVKRRAPFSPVTVAKNLPFNSMAKVQINLPDLPGVDLVTVSLRQYYEGNTIGHLTGYVGRPDYKYKQRLREGKWAPDFPIGRQGLEKIYEESLSGVVGLSQLETNAHGRTVEELSRQDAQDGEDLKLSLDFDLQKKAWKAFGEHVGSAVMINLKTGGLMLAMSKPGFDPNDFSDGLNEEEWQKLVNDENKPLLNRSLQGQYSPGSTFKTIVAMAALQEGLVDDKEVINCKGYIKFGRRKFHCWKRHGRMNIEQAIYQSCDIFFYEMADRLGIEKIAKYARMFGLEEKTTIGLAEKSGLIPTKEWKLRVKGERWVRGENLNTGIGQGFLLMTPTQMATMSARIATGKKIMPVLNFDKEYKNTEHLEDIPIDKEYFDLVRRGMWKVVNQWGGTARGSKQKNFDIAGKTGTVQVVSVRIDEKVTKMSSVKLKRRPHGMFIAYAPAEDPQYAISVVVENGGSGSRAAAPVASKILKYAIEGVS